MRRFAGVCLLGVLCGGVWAGQPLDVRAAYYRIKTPADPGSATAFVRNTGRQPVTIDRLTMDVRPLPAHGIGHRRRRCANEGLRWPGNFSCGFPDFFRGDRAISQT